MITLLDNMKSLYRSNNSNFQSYNPKLSKLQPQAFKVIDSNLEDYNPTEP